MLNEKKFQSIYEEFQKSGLNARAFCSNRQINEAKFYYWKRKLEGNLSREGFVPLVFEQDRASGESALVSPSRFQSNQGASREVTCCEISYPGGIHVKLSGRPDLELLRSLLLLTR
jgi:hypothetical protein